MGRRKRYSAEFKRQALKRRPIKGGISVIIQIMMLISFSITEIWEPACW
jgi:hypothetical protein